VSEESSTNSSVDYDDDEEEPIDYEEEDELIDSDFLTLGSFGPKEDVLEPVPQDEEEGFFTPDKNDSNVHSNVSSMLKDKLAQMLLARQNLIEQNKVTSLIEKHIKDMEAFMAESERELAAMDEDVADAKAKRTLAERELNSNEGPLLLTNGEDDSGNEDIPKPKKRGRL